MKKIIKKIIMAGILIYTYNTISFIFNAAIPINFLTMFLVSILGFPALLLLVLVKFVIF